VPNYDLNWSNLGGLPSRRYTCGFCGSPLASEKGWQAQSKHGGPVIATIYVCHQCSGPTFFDQHGGQVPGSAFGGAVSDIPDESVARLYDEARNATSAGAFTSAVLACRKLLMHIAVAKGASEGKTFISYVEYLAEKNYVPPDAKGWVDHIRARGNEANHQIVIMAKEDAEQLISFAEMLLKIIYEFPASVKKKAGDVPPAT
jgi:hypothetical protein